MAQGFNDGNGNTWTSLVNPTRTGKFAEGDRIYDFATNVNQFGEQSYLDFSNPINDRGAVDKLLQNPMGWLGTAFEQNNMRGNPTYGTFAKALLGGIGSGMESMYQQMYGMTDPNSAGIGEWANRLVSGYRGSGAGEWLGNAGAKDFFGNMLQGNLVDATETLVNTPGNENALIDMLEAVAFQGLTGSRFAAFQQQLQDVGYAWQKAATTHEITFWEFLKGSGLLENFGLA